MAELAESLGVSRNSVFRITSTLHAKGYLVRDERTKRFTLGRVLLRLGYAAVGAGNLVERCLDLMRELRDTTRESTFLGVLAGADGVVLEQLPGLHPVKFLVDVGTRFPLNTSAPAKAMMAALPEAEREAIVAQMPFAPFNNFTITTREAYRAELAIARARGYAVDHAEEIEGVHCVGAAVLDHRDRPVAGVWVTGPANRMPAERFDEMGHTVAAYALSMSRRFGHVPESAEARTRREDGR